MPHIPIQELFYSINSKLATPNRKIEGDLKDKINNATSASELELISFNSFLKPITIDFDKLIKDTILLTDETLKGSGYDYYQKHIDDFRGWVKSLKLDLAGKYIIFQKALN